MPEGINIRFRALTSTKRLPTEAIVAEITEFTIAHVEKIVEKAKVYPPERPNQRYIRTHTLRDNWRVEPRAASGLTVRAINDTPYAQLVQGNKQLPIHTETGWQIVAEHLERDVYLRGIRAIYKKRGMV